MTRKQAVYELEVETPKLVEQLHIAQAPFYEEWVNVWRNPPAGSLDFYSEENVKRRYEADDKFKKASKENERIYLLKRENIYNRFLSKLNLAVIIELLKVYYPND